MLPITKLPPPGRPAGLTGEFMISDKMTTLGDHESLTNFGGRDPEIARFSRVCQVSFPYCTNSHHRDKTRSDFRMIKARNSDSPGPTNNNSNQIK